MNTITAGFTKRAWVRNPTYPIGQKAPGKIACPCGGAPETMLTPETGNITCACGIVYSWNGFIVSKPSAAPSAIPTLPPAATLWENEPDEEEEKP